LPPTALQQPQTHLHLPQDSLPPSQQPLQSPDWEHPLSPVDTPAFAPVPYSPAVALDAKDGEVPPTALPQPHTHLNLPQDSLQPPRQPLYSPDREPPPSPADIAGLAWRITGGLAPLPAVSLVAKDGFLPFTALPQPRAHMHLPLDPPQPTEQPMHRPNGEPPLSPVDTPDEAMANDVGQDPNHVASTVAQDGEVHPSAHAAPCPVAPTGGPPEAADARLSPESCLSGPIGGGS